MWRVVAAVVCGFILACAGARSSARVQEEWLARVPPEQMGDVNAARNEEHSAHDELVRAEVRQRDAEQALTVARAERDAARYSVKAKESALKAAEGTGQGSQIGQAQQGLEAARASLRAAEAKIEWRDADVDAAKAQRKLTEKQADVANARVRVAEYEALKRSGDIRANELSASEFHESLAKAERDAEHEHRVFEERSSAAQDARAEWERAARESQATGGSGSIR